MDFQQLMQQASANQVLVEKKHVLQKKQKEVEKKREIHIHHSQQKKAAERLKVMKDAAHKKQLEYKGLASKASRPLITSASSRKQADETSTYTVASKGSITKEKNLSSSKSSCSSTKLHKTKHKEKGSFIQVQKSKKEQPRPASQSKTKVKPSPVANFQDLMKIAQTNSLKDPSVKLNKTSIVEDTRTKESQSPVGKLLLERSSQRSKMKPKVEINAELERSKGTDTSISRSKVLLSPTRADDLVRRPLRDPTPVSGTVVTKNHLNSTPTKANRGDRTTCRPSTKGIKLPQSCSTSGPQNPVRGFKTPSIPLALSSKQLQQQRKERIKAAATARASTSQTPRSKPLNATAFYGAAASRILGSDGRISGSRYAPSKYTSSWVDEMTDYLRSGDVDDAEDEEDLEDFLDDDFIDDSGEGEDYSSAIREIFGYDKRRFDEERFDDAAMESSYAQQEFEEKRSARLGQLEDEEEFRREQEQFSRKRKKTGGKEKATKQTKLNFR